MQIEFNPKEFFLGVATLIVILKLTGIADPSWNWLVFSLIAYGLVLILEWFLR